MDPELVYLARLTSTVLDTTVGSAYVPTTECGCNYEGSKRDSAFRVLANGRSITIFKVYPFSLTVQFWTRDRWMRSRIHENRPKKSLSEEHARQKS